MIPRCLCPALVWMTCAAGPLAAGEKIEIKYLAPDGPTLDHLKDALKLDDAKSTKTMEIRFFDTPTLALLNDQKLILRLRHKGGAWEFTVKERPASDQTQKALGTGEVTMEKTVGAKESVASYSLDSAPAEEAVQTAIKTNAVQGLLSPEQKAFLEKRSPAVPWDQVGCFPRIESTVWDLTPLDKCDAEQWKYDGGKVIELSLKAKVKNAAKAEEAFSKFLSDAPLSLDPKTSGDMKTRTVLEKLAPSK